MKMVVDWIPKGVGRPLALLLFVGYAIDFIFCMVKRRRNPQEEEPVVGRMRVVK